jgi:hypothetical protein
VGAFGGAGSAAAAGCCCWREGAGLGVLAVATGAVIERVGSVWQAREVVQGRVQDSGRGSGVRVVVRQAREVVQGRMPGLWQSRALATAAAESPSALSVCHVADMQGIVSDANSPFGAGSLTDEVTGEGVCRGVGSCCA